MQGYRFSYTGKTGETLLSERTYVDHEDAAIEAEYVAVFPDRYTLVGPSGESVSAHTIDFSKPVSVITVEAS